MTSNKESMMSTILSWFKYCIYVFYDSELLKISVAISHFQAKKVAYLTIFAMNYINSKVIKISWIGMR